MYTEAAAGDVHRQSFKISGSEVLANLPKKRWLGAVLGVATAPKTVLNELAIFVVWALSTQRCVMAAYHTSTVSNCRR